MGNPYLIVYNTVLCVGWGVCFALAMRNVVEKGTVEDFWKQVQTPLKIFQTAACLEILHAAIGLVRSPLMVTTMQVFSRVWIVWGIINPVQHITTTQSVELFKLGEFVFKLDLVSLVVAWSLAEIIRYGFFALKELQIDSSLFKWLRYTGFIALYPLGVSCELSLVLIALPFIHSSKLWSLNLPNAMNFAFDYSVFCSLGVLSYIPSGSELALVWLALPVIRDCALWSLTMPNSINFAFNYYLYVIIYSLGYIPFFPQLYLYMFGQRKKVLAAKPKVE